MPFRVSGKNIDVGEALRTRVTARVSEATAKYFDGGFSGHATIAKDGFGFRTECVIHLDTGVVLEVEAFAPDAYASADQAASRIESMECRCDASPTSVTGLPCASGAPTIIPAHTSI